MPENNGTARLDRIERSLELLIADHVQFREEHKQLLTAQVVLTDRVDRLSAQVEKVSGNVDRFVQATGERMAELTDKLSGLIGYVEGMQPPSKS